MKAIKDKDFNFIVNVFTASFWQSCSAIWLTISIKGKPSCICNINQWEMYFIEDVFSSINLQYLNQLPGIVSLSVISGSW